MDLEESEKLIEEISKRVKQLHGKVNMLNLYSCSITVSSLFDCKCQLRHSFETSLERLRLLQWCKTCSNSLLKAKEFALSKGGILLSPCFGKELHFKCHKGHSWKVSCKSYARSWCTECNKECKLKLKQFIKDQASL